MSLEPRSPELPRRAGKNLGGYQGERIDIWPLIAETERLAAQTGWTLDSLSLTEGCKLPILIQRHPKAKRNVYISGGIHGDEPAGPLCIRELLREGNWPSQFNYWLIPCLNPAGFERNRRENEHGIDLNRDYKARRSEVVRAHIDWLKQQPNFDLALLLHEDWESAGFYLYELNPDNRPSVAESVIQAVNSICPIEAAEQIEGRPATGGMIRFVGSIPEREEWPEAIHLIHHKTRLNYTLEGPSDFELEVRVRALTAATRAALHRYIELERL